MLKDHNNPPIFCLNYFSAPNLEALALEANESQVWNGDSVANSYLTLPRCFFVPITVGVSTFGVFTWFYKFSIESSNDRFSQFGSDSIQEAHALLDRYSLDVYVADGWPYECLAIVLNKESSSVPVLGFLAKAMSSRGILWEKAW
ncbi:hypothetical protein L6452_19618 [Arctium lappa]|uniref:Uncharacterized protein n=1 Tax=Arctium lappa TaxID=4217 RepID=A0ACB9BAG1_ARCLA|nr:hypothetical protein L6452_19618 [Arctium lappa]